MACQGLTLSFSRPASRISRSPIGTAAKAVSACVASPSGPTKLQTPPSDDVASPEKHPVRQAGGKHTERVVQASIISTKPLSPPNSQESSGSAQQSGSKEVDAMTLPAGQQLEAKTAQPIASEVRSTESLAGRPVAAAVELCDLTSKPCYDNIAFIAQSWEKYKTDHRLEHAFQPCRGTERERYSRVLEIEEKMKQEEDKGEIVILVAGEVVKENHAGDTIKKRGKADTVDDDDSATAGATVASTPTPTRKGRRGRPRKHAKKYTREEKTVQQGINELKAYRECYRPTFSKKEDIETLSMSVDGTKVFLLLLYHEPYMGYLPGEYVLRIMERDDYDNPKVKKLLAPTRTTCGVPEGWLCEGTVPFSKEQYLSHFTEDVFSAMVEIIVAFVGFNPLQPEHMATVLQLLCKQDPTLIKPREVDWLKQEWQRKFQDMSTRPQFMTEQCYRSKSKIWEAAWLLKFLEKDLKVDLEPQWVKIRWFLEEMMGHSCDTLAVLYKYVWLRDEALGRINDGYNDQVLAYKSGWHRSIHTFYEKANNWPSPAPFNKQRMVELKEAATKVLGPKRVQDILNSAPDCIQQRYTQRDKDLDKDIQDPWNNLPSASGRVCRGPGKGLDFAPEDARAKIAQVVRQQIALSQKQRVAATHAPKELQAPPQSSSAQGRQSIYSQAPPVNKKKRGRPRKNPDAEPTGPAPKKAKEEKKPNQAQDSIKVASSTAAVPSS